MKRSSLALLAGLIFSLASAARATAATDPALVEPVDRLIAAILTNDAGRIARTYAPSPLIVDEFAPFTWSGGAAPAAWLRGFVAAGKAGAVTAMHVTHGPVATANLSDDSRRAYVIFPSAFAYRAKGVPVRETGTWAFVMMRESRRAPWRIVASTWATVMTVAGSAAAKP